MTDHAEALAKALEEARFWMMPLGHGNEGGELEAAHRLVKDTLAAYRSVGVTGAMVREIWGHATNATCQTLQDKGMCNCPDGGCVAATVEPETADLTYHCTVATQPAGEPVGYASDYGMAKLAEKANHYCLSLNKRPEKEFHIPLYATPALAGTEPAGEVVDAPYVVWSNAHKAWWRSNSSGYTRLLDQAGRYPRQEALEIARCARDGWTADGLPDEIAVPLADAEFCRPAARDQSEA